MTKIDHAITAVTPLLSKATTDPKELPDVIARLFREEVDLGTLVKFIIDRGHEREKQDLPEASTVEDLKDFLRSLLEPSPANRKRWSARFKSGNARYLCPQCGFAGNDDDFKTPDSGNTICSVCGCFKDKRYFTRWSADERAAFEIEQQRLQPIRLAQEKRAREKRQRAVELEPKVEAVLKQFEGTVEGYTDECEERGEVTPFVRAVVHATTIPVERIVAEWAEHQGTHKAVAQFTRMPLHEFAARIILKEFSMKEILDNLDQFVPSELDSLEAGEERFFFTREEFIHEMTVNTANWQDLMDTRDLSTSLGMDGRFAITVHAKGYAEAHPCPCDDCRRALELNPIKAGSCAQ